MRTCRESLVAVSYRYEEAILFTIRYGDLPQVSEHHPRVVSCGMMRVFSHFGFQFLGFRGLTTLDPDPI